MREVQTRLQLAFFPCYLPNLVRAVLARPRLVMWLEIAFIAYLLMFVSAPPALAAPPNPLEALDRTDGSGYSISNYNIEFLLDVLSTKYPMQSMTAGIVGFLWDACRYGVGAVALLIDLTLGFGWLTYLIYPIEQTAEVLDGVLDQLPMVRELLIVLACVVGIARMYVGQKARGLTDMFGSFVLWGISAAIVTNPVAWLTGPTGFLTRTQEAAQQFSAQLVNPDAAIGEVDATQASGTMGQQIVSIFVRSPHQFIAYGGLADGGGCEATYNENLTKSGEDLANAMLSCSSDFGATIKNPSSVTLVTTLIILVGIAVLLAIAVVCSMIIIYEIANMLIAGVMAVWELFRGVGPGGSYRGFIGIAINLLESFLALMAVVLISGLYLATVQYFFTEWEENMIVLFLIVDLVLIVVIAVIFQQRKKLRKALDRMRERARAQSKNVPVPKQLSARHHVGGGLAAGAASRAGSKLAQGAGQLGSRVKHGAAALGRGAGNVATAPVRAGTRRVSRPGFMAARLGSGMLHRAGIHDKRSHKLMHGIAHRSGEAKWRKKEARRVERREQRQERRQQSRFWTWSGATRDAELRAADRTGVDAATPRQGRRPQRRSAQAHGPAQEQHPSPRSSRRPSPSQDRRTRAPGADAAEAPRRSKGAAPRPTTSGKSAPVPSGAGRQPSPTGPATRDTSSSAGDRLNAKMRARRGASSSPRPRSASRPLQNRARARAAGKGAA